MNKPELLGLEVLTPDGRGHILSLHNKGVTVGLNILDPNNLPKVGILESKGGLHYFYKYEDVDIIKGRYCFDDTRINFQYNQKPRDED